MTVPQRTYPLDEIPPGAELCGVTARIGEIGGRKALCLELLPSRRSGKLGVDYGDQPTFLLLPETLQHGIIEVDLLGRLLPDAPDYARGFIGLAYRVQGSGQGFECTYLRPTNGQGLHPPAPRDQRALQVFAFPDWPFDRLRNSHPGTFERAADISPDRWHRLRVEVEETRLLVSIDGVKVLQLATGLIAPASGRLGLWVDIGTEGWFSNLRVLSQLG
jgi:hypothetical protein